MSQSNVEQALKPLVSALIFRASFTAASKNLATSTKSSSANPLEVRAGVPKSPYKLELTISYNWTEQCKDDQQVGALSILMPPGTIADTSPGTVFLFAAMCTDSMTFSTLEPSIPYRENFRPRRISTSRFLATKHTENFRPRSISTSRFLAAKFC